MRLSKILILKLIYMTTMNVIKNECNYYKHIRLCCKRIKMHAIHVYQILWIHSMVTKDM